MWKMSWKFTYIFFLGTRLFVIFRVVYFIFELFNDNHFLCICNFTQNQPILCNQYYRGWLYIPLNMHTELLIYGDAVWGLTISPWGFQWSHCNSKQRMLRSICLWDPISNTELFVTEHRMNWVVATSWLQWQECSNLPDSATWYKCMQYGGMFRFLMTSTLLRRSHVLARTCFCSYFVYSMVFCCYSHISFNFHMCYCTCTKYMPLSCTLTSFST